MTDGLVLYFITFGSSTSIGNMLLERLNIQVYLEVEFQHSQVPDKWGFLINKGVGNLFDI